MYTYTQYVKNEPWGMQELHEKYIRATPIASGRGALLTYRRNNRDDRKHLYAREHVDGYDIHDENGDMVASYILTA